MMPKEAKLKAPALYGHLFVQMMDQSYDVIDKGILSVHKVSINQGLIQLDGADRDICKVTE